ncbi:MAG: polyphenol oxidase family protein [Deltaproteobacteria bacterium]|nr:polyphenol oxidase family protein [Deltaproteobacteria bacterium]MCX7952830.1 polyphenol oxidase family protein [Deltaproteobacteria bacterium]
MISLIENDSGYHVRADLFSISFLNKKGSVQQNCEDLLTLKQVHSSLIISDPQGSLEGDGILIGDLIKKGGIYTADCIPFAILGSKKLVLLHCGWRGIKDQIILKGLESLGERPRMCLVGPCARRCCYEVKRDFLDLISTSAHFKFHNQQIFFDLVGYACDFLPKEIPVFDLRICTICNTNWHSYRRQKTKMNNLTVARLVD